MAKGKQKYQTLNKMKIKVAPDRVYRGNEKKSGCKAEAVYVSGYTRRVWKKKTSGTKKKGSRQTRL